MRGGAETKSQQIKIYVQGDGNKEWAWNSEHNNIQNVELLPAKSKHFVSFAHNLFPEKNKKVLPRNIIMSNEEKEKFLKIYFSTISTPKHTRTSIGRVSFGLGRPFVNSVKNLKLEVKIPRKISPILIRYFNEYIEKDFQERNALHKEEDKLYILKTTNDNIEFSQRSAYILLNDVNHFLQTHSFILCNSVLGYFKDEKGNFGFFITHESPIDIKYHIRKLQEISKYLKDNNFILCDIVIFSKEQEVNDRTGYFHYFCEYDVSLYLVHICKNLFMYDNIRRFDYLKEDGKIKIDSNYIYVTPSSNQKIKLKKCIDYYLK